MGFMQRLLSPCAVSERFADCRVLLLSLTSGVRFPFSPAASDKGDGRGSYACRRHVSCSAGTGDVLGISTHGGGLLPALGLKAL